MTAEIASPRLAVRSGGGSWGIGIRKSLAVTSLTVDGATPTGAGWARDAGRRAGAGGQHQPAGVSACNPDTQALQALTAGGQLDSITSLARTNSTGIGGRLRGRGLLGMSADGAACGFSMNLDKCWAHLAATVAIRGRPIRATGDGAKVAADANGRELADTADIAIRGDRVVIVVDHPAKVGASK